MNIGPVLLDIDILTAIMRGEPQATARARAYLAEQRRFSFSVIRRYEVLRGLFAKGAVRQRHAFGRRELAARKDCIDTKTPRVEVSRRERQPLDTMRKILVTYASKYGSTGEVAQAIADQLCLRSAAADVRRVEEVTDASGYDAVVVGSAVRMGRWLTPAVEFVEKNAAALQKAPTAFFTVHMLATDDSEASRQQRAAYVAPVHAALTPQHEAFFAGEIDTSRLALGDRLMVKLVRSRTGDYRDWPGIRSWADQLFVGVV